MFDGSPLHDEQQVPTERSEADQATDEELTKSATAEDLLLAIGAVTLFSGFGFNRSRQSRSRMRRRQKKCE